MNDEGNLVIELKGIFNLNKKLNEEFCVISQIWLITKNNICADARIKMLRGCAGFQFSSSSHFLKS